MADLTGRKGRPNSFNFMQFLGKFGRIVCWHPRELAPSHLSHCLEYFDLELILTKGEISSGVESIRKKGHCKKFSPYRMFVTEFKLVIALDTNRHKGINGPNTRKTTNGC